MAKQLSRIAETLKRLVAGGPPIGLPQKRGCPILATFSGRRVAPVSVIVPNQDEGAPGPWHLGTG